MFWTRSCDRRWLRELAVVAPPKRALVTTAVRTVNEIYAAKAAQQLKSATESQRNIIAALAMRLAPGKLSAADAKQLAFEAIRVSEAGDIGEYQRFQQQMQILGLTPPQSATLAKVAATSYEHIMAMQQQMSGLGNFASEQRVGQFVLAYDMAGERKYEGIKDRKEGAQRERELMSQGASNFKAIDKGQLAEDAQAANSLEGMETINKIVTESFQKQVEAVKQLDPTIAEFMQKTFNPVQGLAEFTAVSSAQKNMLKRNLAGGRESVDYVETMFDNVARTSVSLARRSAREDYTLHALELEQLGQGALVSDLNKHLADVMTPDSPTYAKFKTFVTAFHVVNVANAMLEGVQMLSSGNSELFREGLNTKQIFEGWNENIRRLAGWSMDGKFGNANLGKFKSAADLGARIEDARFTTAPMLENKDATIAHYLRRMNDEARLGHEPILDVGGEDLLYTNLARATKQNDFQWVDTPKLIGNGLYQASRNALRLYGVMPRMNNWLASTQALSVGYDKGLRGNELFTYATGLKDAMVVSGGRANRPTLYAMANGKLVRPAVGMATMLSNYSLGMITIMGGAMKDAMAGASGLRPEQRIAAGKAAANALVVQLSMSGALGLPLAGAAIYFIEQLFGVNAEKKMREVAKLGFGEDFGNMVSDVAMNGWVNRTTGLDVAGRAGINSLFGINGYNGFDPSAIFGPSVSVAKDLWQASQDASQGDGLKAATRIAPKGVRGLVDTVRSYKEYGDLRFMDSSNNLLYKAGPAEALGYAMGFQPAGSKRAKQEGRLVTTSEHFYSQKNNREMDMLAEGLLKGDKRSIAQMALNRADDPTFNPKEFIANVVERAVDMEVEKDPTAHGARGNVKSRREIGQLGPAQVQEVQRTSRKAELLAQLGNPLGLQVTQKDLLRAMVVDELRSKKPMTRQEALIVAEKLLGN
jgi:hypothetical protein